MAKWDTKNTVLGTRLSPTRPEFGDILAKICHLSTSSKSYEIGSCWASASASVSNNLHIIRELRAKIDTEDYKELEPDGASLDNISVLVERERGCMFLEDKETLSRFG